MIAFLALSIGALLMWLVFCIRWRLTHDEFERLVELIFGAPALPVVLAAPIFSIAYGVVRFMLGRAYR
ncbi:MAG: hypothetical protein ACK4NP_12555 [Parvularculaceae bacterium]